MAVRNVLNLYRIVSLEEARAFDVGKLLSSVIEKLDDATGAHPNSFDINYRDVRKTTKTFLKAIDKRKEVVFACAGYGAGRPLLSFSNHLLNSTEPPPLDSIDLTIDFYAEHPIETLYSIVSKAAETLEFDYGYIAKLPVTHDSLTERKVKRSLFGLSESISITASDHFYSKHIPAVKHGYLRSLYNHNFLNDSHLSNIHIDALIKDGIGRLSQFNDGITLWSLEDDEIPSAKESLTASKVILWSPDGPTPIQCTAELDVYDTIR